MSPLPAFRSAVARLADRAAAVAAVAALAVAAATCGDSVAPRPTPPPVVAATPLPRAARLATSCQRTDATALQQGISTLFAQSVRQTARDFERAVERACPDTGAMLNYAAAVVDWHKNGLTLGTQLDGGNPALWAYLVRVFRYVGYTLPPESAGALTKAGFIGVCDDSKDCLLKSDLLTSGIALWRGSLGGKRVLVSGAPASCGPASANTNLEVWGQCVDISADPKDGPTFPLSRPTDSTTRAPALVQTCVAEDVHHNPLVEYLYDTTGRSGAKPGRLAKLSGGDTRVSVQPAEPQFFEANCNWAQTVAAAPSAPTGPFGSVTRVASRALAGVAEMFAPRVADAAHGGLGTLPGGTNSLSLFGPIDPFLFQATFTGDVLGQLPGSPDRGRGSWLPFTVNPGDIVVRASLGDIGSNLVVINQQGGVAPNKDGIQLLARVATKDATRPRFATTGTYRIRWRSLVATPKAFDANFNVLDSGSPSQLLARFTYANSAAAQGGPILFNGNPTGATWTQNVSQAFEITVNLDDRRVSFGLQGSAPLVSLQPFAGPGIDLAKVGWQIKSQNAQTIGMDDVEIVRVPDSAAAP